MDLDCSMSVTLVELNPEDQQLRFNHLTSSMLSEINHRYQLDGHSLDQSLSVSGQATSVQNGPSSSSSQRSVCTIDVQPSVSSSQCSTPPSSTSSLPNRRPRGRPRVRPRIQSRPSTVEQHDSRTLPQQRHRNERSTGTLNSVIFDRLVEDNFIQISLQDELLALGSGLRQFERTKYQELTRVIGLFNSSSTFSMNTNTKLTIERVQRHTEKWINSIKLTSSFNNICLADQILCIKSNFTELCIISSLGVINPVTRSIQKGQLTISMEKCPMMNDPRFVYLLSNMNQIFRFDPIVNLLLVLTYLFNVNTPTVHSAFTIRKEYIITIHLLQKYLEAIGFTSDQANCEISKAINQLNCFLTLFNGKEKILTALRSAIVNKSQLLSELLDIFM